MTKNKLSFIVILFVLGFIFLGITNVYAVTYADLKWHSVGSVFEKGEECNERFVDHIDGLTYTLNSSYDNLPNGLSLSNDGRIVGTVNETQDLDEYEVLIMVNYDNSSIGAYELYFNIIDDFATAEWANIDNLFMDNTTVYENGDKGSPIHTENGFLVYTSTLANYISYNALEKTYNVTLTQDFTQDTISNFVEFIFKASEYSKLLKFETIESEGFISHSPYIITVTNYHYTHNSDNLYSSFIREIVDTTYTGSNRHAKIKISNPYDTSQYRYINFNIVDSNEIFVAFETNGGSAITSLQKNIGDKITLPTQPTKEGWVFDGWYTNSNLTTAFNVNTELTNNTILYAKWRNDYKFTNGANQKCVLDKNVDATFRINAKLELLDKVYIDDAEIDNSKFTLASGSTIITLLKNYLTTLTVGNHTLKATYRDGQTVQTTFEITKKDATPKTGNEDYSIIATSICILSLVGIVALNTKKEN